MNADAGVLQKTAQARTIFGNLAVTRDIYLRSSALICGFMDCHVPGHGSCGVACRKVGACPP
jgi:hypothetical protein